MPFDSNGNFSLVPGTIVSTGETVLPSQHNPPFIDVAGGLSMAVLRDGRAPWTGNQDLNGFRLTNMGDAVNPGDAVALRQVSEYLDNSDVIFWLAATL